MGKAIVIKTDGTEIDLRHRPSLSEAQEIVGGYIELIPIKHSRLTLVVDEDAKVKTNKPPINTRAKLYFGIDLLGDIIVLEGWRTVGNG